MIPEDKVRGYRGVNHWWVSWSQSPVSATTTNCSIRYRGLSHDLHLMPPRLERRQQTGNLHFITFSCHNRNPYLASPRAASIFEHSLESTRERYQFHLLGYVVMPEHIHLLLSEPPTHPLSTVLGALKRSVSKQRPETPFWLPRYHDFNIFSPTKHREKLRCLHRNPVARGLVSTPADYPWSSFQTYATRTQTTVKIAIHLGAP